ncbi:MAG: hypothetical protein KDD61_11710, partial [Bdellovibrionales bacterium]|nr:hypothetical protein [Bdellovibrionales bacterium]
MIVLSLGLFFHFVFLLNSQIQTPTMEGVMWLCVSELILLLGVTAGTGYLWGHYNTKVVDPTPTISQAHKQYKDDAETIFSVFP